MSDATTTRRYTVAEYLAIDPEPRRVYELHGERLIEVVKDGDPHGRIARNVARAIGGRLRGRADCSCRNDVRVRVGRRPWYVYPDLAVVRGPAEFDPADRSGLTTTNPTAVVEVMTPETELADLSGKFHRYLECPSVQTYVQVWSDRMHARSYSNNRDGTWAITFADTAGDVVTLRGLGVDVPLAEVYAGVDLPVQTTAGGSE